MYLGVAAWNHVGRCTVVQLPTIGKPMAAAVLQATWLYGTTCLYTTALAGLSVNLFYFILFHYFNILFYYHFYYHFYFTIITSGVVFFDYQGWFMIYLNKMQVDVAKANQHSECIFSGAIVCQPAPWCMCRWCHAAMLCKLLLPGMRWQESFTQPGCIVPSTHALWCV
jgi:hypothetical protein